MPTSDGPEPSRSGKTDHASALYLYCVAWPRAAALAQGTGVDGCHPVETRTYGNLAAVVSDVAVNDFCGAAAEARLQDLTWVGPRACCHEAVVEEAMRVSPVFPARFGTLFSSPETLAAFLQDQGAAIRRFLKRTADREEWVVKGTLVRKIAVEQIASQRGAPARADLAGAAPGTRFFGELRMRTEAKQQVNAWLKNSCDNLIASLGYRPAEIRRRRIPATAAENGVELVLNCALLVRRSAVSRLRAKISRANERHAGHALAFSLTGPWPPYSFCSSLAELPEAEA